MTQKHQSEPRTKKTTVALKFARFKSSWCQRVRNITKC